MTTTAARIPRPRLAEGAARRRRGRVARTRTLQAIEWPLWAVARTVARYPKTAAALSVAVTATTPATLREVTGVVVGGSAVMVFGHIFGAGAPASAPSLADVTKFRRLRKLVRRRWVTVMADCGLARPHVYGGPDRRRPRLLRVTQEPLGVRLLIDGSRVSAGADVFVGNADKLRAGFRCLSVKVNPNPKRRTLINVHLRYQEPFRRTIRINELPAPTHPMHVVVGVDEDGYPLEKDLRLPNLFVGSQGSGKSSETWTILHQIIQARIPLRLRVFDPKGGQEFGELEDAAWEYERMPTHWAQFLEHAHLALAAKQAEMRRLGLRKLDYFSARFPLDLMIVDELITALAFGSGSTKAKVAGKPISAEDAFMTYLSTARAAGHDVFASAQLAQKDVISKVRGLFPYVTCLRMAPTEKDMVDVLLGSGASKAYPAHQLPAHGSEGIGYFASPGGLKKYRAAFLTDAERARTVRGVASWTKRLRPVEGEQ